MNYINDPKTRDDAVQIMATRVGLAPAEYQSLLAGTHLINVAEAKKSSAKARGSNRSTAPRRMPMTSTSTMRSISSRRIDSYIDPALTTAQP